MNHRADRMQLYLAMEEKEEKSAFKAAQLCSSFEKSFLRMSYTVHPSNIPGEAQGKSSNESWAAKQALRDYADATVKRNAIFTVMDGRSVLLSLSTYVLKFSTSGHASLLSLLCSNRSTA